MEATPALGIFKASDELTTRERVLAALEMPPRKSRAQCAREVGVSETQLSQYLNNKYPGDVSGLEAKLEKWLRSIDEKRATQQIVPPAPAFFESQTSSEIMNVFRYAQSVDDMVTVIGGPGIGKSTSCKEYQRSHPKVWLATMAAHTTGVVPVLKEICEAVDGAHANGASALAREICRKIANTNGLLIVDEAHHVSIAALDAIRALHDATETAIALVGSTELAGKFERMPQLYSRLGLRLHRQRVVAKDVDALIEAWGLTGKPERKLIMDIAKGPGALRTATKVLRLATASARVQGEDLALQHIRDAALTRGARVQATDDAE